MSEKLTVAELLARNAKAGGKNTSDRPRRRRNLDDGGVSVSELTGSIPVVKVDGADGGDAGAPEKTHGGHEADPEDTGTGTAATSGTGTGKTGGSAQGTESGAGKPAQTAQSAKTAKTGPAGKAPQTAQTGKGPQGPQAGKTGPAAAPAPAAPAAPVAQSVPELGGFDQQSTIVQAVIPDSLLESPKASVPVSGPATPGKADTTDKADKAGKADAADTTDKADDTGRTGKTGTPGKAGSAGTTSGAAASAASAAAATKATGDSARKSATGTPAVVDGEVVSGTTGRPETPAAPAAPEAPAPAAAAASTGDSVRNAADDDTDDTSVAGATAAAAADDLAVAADDDAEGTSAVAGDGQRPAPGSNEIIEYEDDSISWPSLVGQAALAVVIGVLIFFGFTVLWGNLGTVLVLVMALVVTFVCVGVVHALLRHRDTLILVLTFVVGLALTVGPRLVLSL